LLNIPVELGFEHTLYLNKDDFSVIMQYLSILESIMRLFKDWEFNFNNLTRVETRYVKGKGLDFLHKDLILEKCKQVN